MMTRVSAPTRKVMRSVMGVSGPNEENNEKSYGSFSVASPPIASSPLPALTFCGCGSCARLVNFLAAR